MRRLSDTRAIFQQLAAAPGNGGVRVIIENHDAWIRNEEADGALTTALRVALVRSPRDPQRAARIERQRQRLLPLVTKLRSRLSSAS